MDLFKQNWFNHEGKRYYKENSFDFILESVGVYTNSELIVNACDIIIAFNKKIQDDSITSDNLLIEKSISTIKNSLDIRLNNIDYTIGKIIECVLHENYYKGKINKLLSYVGFRKNHPHETFSIIRIGFIENDEASPLQEKARDIINDSCKQAIQIINNIKEDLLYNLSCYY